MPELKSWGVEWNQTMSYASYHECPDCEFEKWGMELFKNSCVGFTAIEPFVSAGGIMKIGKLIFKCRKCNCIFWFHVDEDLVKILMGYPNWPK